MFRRKKKAPNPWLLLSNPITRLSLPEDQFSKLLYGFLAREPLQTFAERTRQLLRTKRFHEFQNFSAKSVEKFGRFDVLGNQFVESRAWVYYSEIISHYSEIINTFVLLREQIESSIILGQLDRAEQILNALEEKAGESLWSIRTRGLIVGEKGGEKEVDEFFSSVEERTDAPLIRFTLKSLRLVSNAEHSVQRLNTLVIATINEFRETKETDLVGFVHALLCPDPLIAREKMLPALHLFQLLPVIDLYVTLQRVCAHEIASGQTTNAIANFLAAIARTIKDPANPVLSPEKNSVGQSSVSSVGTEILCLYEQGKYAAALEAFQTAQGSLPNPLAYANIIAKAAAHCSSCAEHENKSVLSSLIAALTEIYSLTPQTTQAADRIKSIAIRLNHFLLGSHIQLCLFKAMPIQFDLASIEYSARIATALNPEVTPQTSRLTNYAAFGVRYQGCIDVSVPAHRRLKREICNLGTDPRNKEEVLRKLGELKDTDGLTKDYLEIFSEYCLAAECWSELLDEAAKYLIQNGESIVSIPMAPLVKYIEDEEPTSVEALVVAAKFVKMLDDSKDYVLHESVERYLEEVGASRPMELLAKCASPLDASERHFFMEICALDVMDYLSCFKSSDELRAERVLILDRMLELGEIEPQFRMRELEDMVAQMIADAGTTEVSGPKIYVDTSATIRKISDEIAALFITYKSAADGEDLDYRILDRISVDDGEVTNEESSVKFAWVIGGKNSLLMKMFRTAKEAFLFDEKNGLDKNLSTEIRHGFFANLIRARLEERHLLTELDDEGQYTPNWHWRNATELLLDVIRDDIEKALQDFSAGINDAISEAEQWMKIERGDKEGKGMRFEIPLQVFEATKAVLNGTTDPQAVASIIVESLWVVTEYRIAEVREKVNTLFRASVDKLFSTLETEIGLSKRGAPLIDLTSAIIHTRGEIRDDITIAADWFRRTDASSFEARSLTVAIQIAAKAFERVRGLVHAIEGEFDDNVGSVIVAGPAVRPLTIALVNLFDNAFRHSGHGRATTVTVSGKEIEGEIQVDIENAVSDERRLALTDDFLLALNRKAKSSASIELLRAEGGTGVVKAYQQVLASHGNSDLTLSFNGEFFTARIIYGT